MGQSVAWCDAHGSYPSDEVCPDCHAQSDPGYDEGIEGVGREYNAPSSGVRMTRESIEANEYWKAKADAAEPLLQEAAIRLQQLKRAHQALALIFDHGNEVDRLIAQKALDYIYALDNTVEEIHRGR